MPWTDIENAKYDMDGSAFPRFSAKPTPGGGIHYDVSGGMSLRDYFAAHAPEPDGSWMRMMRSIDEGKNPYNEHHKPALRDDFQLTAIWKFAHADAMLAAREGK